MLSLIPAGPFLILGDKGKYQTCSLNFAWVSALKLNHPLLYDDDSWIKDTRWKVMVILRDGVIVIE